MLREKSDASSFFKRLIKRSNRFSTMFGHGRGRVEYVDYAKSMGEKATETVSFATTRFFSSAFTQWKKVHNNFPSLIKAYKKFRETDDDCEETKFEDSN